MQHQNRLGIALPFILGLIGPIFAPLVAGDAAGWKDPSPHKVQFVTVEGNVRLEVLDWGGTGRPMVLLAGLGNSAHVFDDFAPKLTGTYHVYGITRRGYGASSVPDSGYDAYHLGDDVLAVLDALKLTRPLLAGHSVAGEELSAVGSRHSERIAGLIYLDAAYPYAFDDGKGTTMAELQQGAPRQPSPSSEDTASVAAYLAWQKRIRGIAMPEADVRETTEIAADGRMSRPRTPAKIGQAIQAGTQKFSEIPVPVLAICAVPQDRGPWLRESSDPAIPAYLAKVAAAQEKQVHAFETGVPTAKVVRLANANHYVFISNESDVIREMRTFTATLK